MNKSKLSLWEIEKELGADHSWVQACLNIWKFPREVQEHVFAPRGKLASKHLYMSDIRDLEGTINRNLDKAIEAARQIIKERANVAEKKKIIGIAEKQTNEQLVKNAKNAISKITPEVKEPESPEELEKAAEALKKEAKKRKSPKQIHQEKWAKVREA